MDREYRVESLTQRPGGSVLKLRGVDSIGQAEALAGCEIVVPEEAMPSPAADRHYIADLVGCRVATSGGEAWGVVAEVMEAGGAAVLVVQRADGREALVPLASAVCPVIETAAKRIVIDPPDGLWDLNEI
ncbi:MAG: ribosome maturation factor RimM [Candidatus Aminicenantes bacterium]|nr:ribosome maturation factor RimM [Candidatus Aminicenantes bacterium]